MVTETSTNHVWFVCVALASVLEIPHYKRFCSNLFEYLIGGTEFQNSFEKSCFYIRLEDILYRNSFEF